MPTDPLDACRARWRGTIPLTNIHLREALHRQCDADTISMFVAEVLRLREENTMLRNRYARLHVGQSWSAKPDEINDDE